MSDIAIRVESLSKSYTIKRTQGVARYRTLQEEIVGLIRRPFQKSDHTKGPETIWAIKDLSLEVKQGEVVGIVGRNGAGKSTLLKILSRITEPTTGYADIYGRLGSLLEVGTGFSPELTGRENIYLNGTILGMKKSEIGRKFDEIVAFAEVEKFLDTPVKHYSSGMYVRLAFAVAAHLDLEILLVDEVLAVGDVAFQKKCLGKMGDVAREEGRTVLFVSHNMGTINSICSRCLMLQNGELQLDGPSESVINSYLRTGVTDSPTISLPSVDSDAYFNSIGLQDIDGEPSTHFDVRKPITLILEFTLERHISGIEVCIDVFNSRGERIFFSSNACGDKPLLVEDAGIHNLSVCIPGNFLPPGSYSISVALHRPRIQFFDRREQILNFEIEETGLWRAHNKREDMGLVLVDLDWRQLDQIQE